MSKIDRQHVRLMEALLFASSTPVPESTINERLPDDADISNLLVHLREHYKERGVNLVKSKEIKGMTGL